MAEPLKNQFGPEIPNKIAGMISDVFPEFDSAAINRSGMMVDALAGSNLAH